MVPTQDVLECFVYKTCYHVTGASSSVESLILKEDLNSFRTPNTGYPLQIQDGSLFFGGLPKDYNLAPGASASANPFTGCLADATIGGVLINFANVTDRHNAFLNKCPMGSDPVDYPAPSRKFHTSI